MDNVEINMEEINAITEDFCNEIDKVIVAHEALDYIISTKNKIKRDLTKSNIGHSTIALHRESLNYFRDIYSEYDIQPMVKSESYLNTHQELSLMYVHVEGIGSKIADAAKWIWEKIRQLWNKIKEFFSNLFKSKKEANKELQEIITEAIPSAPAQPENPSETVEENKTEEPAKPEAPKEEEKPVEEPKKEPSKYDTMKEQLMAAVIAIADTEAKLGVSDGVDLVKRAPVSIKLKEENLKAFEEMTKKCEDLIKRTKEVFEKDHGGQLTDEDLVRMLINSGDLKLCRLVCMGEEDGKAGVYEYTLNPVKHEESGEYYFQLESKFVSKPSNMSSTENWVRITYKGKRDYVKNNISKEMLNQINMELLGPEYKILGLMEKQHENLDAIVSATISVFEKMEEAKNNTLGKKFGRLLKTVGDTVRTVTGKALSTFPSKPTKKE